MSTYLIDTHILIWSLEGNEKKLGRKIYEIIQDPQNLIWISVVSAWEIVVKSMLGKLSIPKNLTEEIDKIGFKWLNLELTHVLQLKKLPNIHADPFDRLLIAQSQITQATLITKDKYIFQYELSVLE